MEAMAVAAAGRALVVATAEGTGETAAEAATAATAAGRAGTAGM